MISFEFDGYNEVNMLIAKKQEEDNPLNLLAANKKPKKTNKKIKIIKIKKKN
jgi:hypothetical protein